MHTIQLFQITRPEEIGILLGRESSLHGFHYTYDHETIDLLKNNFRREGSLYLVARLDNTFAAFISTDTDWWQDNCYFIREVFVSPDFQGHGLGKLLMTKCIEHARKHRAKSILTETAFGNIPMQGLCVSLGFQSWDNPVWKEGITYRLELV